ncbi:MAG: isochorismatase family protein, partial [Hyphomicrobiaceae bacterium]
GRTSFSCWRDQLLSARLRELRQSGRDQVVVCGLEAHVAVCQSTLDLLAHDFDGFVVADATASASAESHALALQRMGRCGAAVVDTEMIAYEWLQQAGTPEFKDLVPLLG